MLPDTLLVFIVLGPGLAALIAGLGQKIIGDTGAMVLTTVVVALAGILSLWQLFAYVAGLGGAEVAAAGHGGAVDAHGVAAASTHVKQHIIHLFNWIDVGQFKANWAIRVDTLSIVMMAVVTSVSGLVHIYSWGYMRDDPHRARLSSPLAWWAFL